MKNIEPWERPHMKKYVRVFLASGLAGALALVGISVVFRDRAWACIGLGMLWLPWMISGILLVPRVFHSGTELQRRRQAEQGGASAGNCEGSCK